METLYWRVKNSLSWSSPIGTGHKIAKVYIGEEVDTIPEDLCDAFTNLNYVEIGRNVKHIGDYAFQNCKNLKEIRIHAEIPPSIGLFGFFMTASEDVSVVVPCNSVTAYKESYFYNGYGWNNMTILADDDCPNTQTYTVTVSSANTSMGTVSGGGEYEEGTTATVTATPKSGYKFTKWSDGTTKNPYTFTVTKNVTLTAYFEKESSSSSAITSSSSSASVQPQPTKRGCGGNINSCYCLLGIALVAVVVIIKRIKQKNKNTSVIKNSCRFNSSIY